MQTGNVKRLLVAPLDWGLGHTTRCIPLIRFLHSLGHEVILAGNESQKVFLGKIFPDLRFWFLDGYNVRYSRRPSTFLPAMARQTPRLLNTIKQEHRWLQNQMENEPVDGIISDNRYGLYHPTIPSVILTHQLQILTGLGKIADHYARKWHYQQLSKFSEIWVPDVAGTPNLSGTLGHPEVLPPHTKYIGLLSQYDAIPQNAEGNSLLVLLSGPEPQRSILSDKLWEEVREYHGSVIFVEGSENAVLRKSIPNHISWHKRLTTSELSPLLADASVVICRSGYSTVMDLLALKKKAILIPTPGQTEQQYLGTQLSENGIFFSAPQANFNLATSLQNVFPPATLFHANKFCQFQSTIEAWITSL